MENLSKRWGLPAKTKVRGENVKIKEKSPDIFAKAQTAETRAHVVSEDCAWHAVMKMAEKHGFILQAAGGTAFLATQRSQIDHKGVLEYLKIQRMNGHCPREFGFPGCTVDPMADKPELICSNPACEVTKQKKEITPEEEAAGLFILLTIGFSNEQIRRALSEIDRTITEAEQEAREELEARKRDKIRNQQEGE